MNILNSFLRAGNTNSLKFIGEPVTFNGTDYQGTVGGILADEFLMQEGNSRRRNEERVIEFGKDQFGETTLPIIGQTLRAQSKDYTIIEIEEETETNIFYRVRRPI